MAFLGSFMQYAVVLVILAAIAVGGVFLGKFLRTSKDAKGASNETKE